MREILFSRVNPDDPWTLTASTAKAYSMLGSVVTTWNIDHWTSIASGKVWLTWTSTGLKAHSLTGHDWTGLTTGISWTRDCARLTGIIVNLHWTKLNQAWPRSYWRKLNSGLDRNWIWILFNWRWEARVGTELESWTCLDLLGLESDLPWHDVFFKPTLTLVYLELDCNLTETRLQLTKSWLDLNIGMRLKPKCHYIGTRLELDWIHGSKLKLNWG